MVRRISRAARAALLSVAALFATAAPAEAEATDEKPQLALMGTIPIYWGEGAGFGDVLSGEAEPHWARAHLEADYALRPLDLLSAEGLAGTEYLLLAQPRVLAPAENVALDEWVRGGGQLLLFADPMMTGHSAFGLGDRRRPQDVALLSPILARWGLELQDEMKGEGARLVEAEGAPLPIDRPGRFALVPPVGENAGSTCSLAADAVLATCSIGDGSATILADAALLNLHEPDTHAAEALDRLVELAFANPGN